MIDFTAGAMKRSSGRSPHKYLLAAAFVLAVSVSSADATTILLDQDSFPAAPFNVSAGLSNGTIFGSVADVHDWHR